MPNPSFPLLTIAACLSSIVTYGESMKVHRWSNSKALLSMITWVRLPSASRIYPENLRSAGICLSFSWYNLSHLKTSPRMRSSDCVLFVRASTGSNAVGIKFLYESPVCFKQTKVLKFSSRIFVKHAITDQTRNHFVQRAPSGFNINFGERNFVQIKKWFVLYCTAWFHNLSDFLQCFVLNIASLTTRFIVSAVHLSVTKQDSFPWSRIPSIASNISSISLL